LQTLADLGVHAFAHITGGGFPENVSRVVPAGLAALIDTRAWTIPPIFQLIQREGNIAPDELYRVFNMGIGLVAMLPPDRLDAAQAALPEAVVIGRIEHRAGPNPVQLLGEPFISQSGRSI
jgi:phosphoribosylformylglycinamidine cyclo-ligase